MSRCLYCLDPDGPPSVEHVAPAALGLHSNMTLPMGAVCEPCNNWTGRVVDEPLTQLVEILFIRALHRVPDAAGKRVETIELAEGTGEINFPVDGPFELKMFVASEDDAPHHQPGDNFVFNMVTKRRKGGPQRRRATRSLLKTGLCLVHQGHGEAIALHPDFDETRAAILGAPHHGFLLTAAMQDPKMSPDLRVQFLRTVPGLVAAATLRFGAFQIMTSVLPGKITEETRSWAKDQGWSVMELPPNAEPPRPSQALQRLQQQLESRRGV